MKVLGISGSPVKNGTNEKIIDYVLKKAKEKGFEIKKLNLSENDIKPCTSCNYCRENPGDCSIKDAMEEVRKDLVEADAIIVSSPVYFGSVSAQLKALFDRTLTLRRNNFRLKDKIGAAIAVGRSRNGGQEFTIQAIHSWMHIHGMVVVGDNNHFGGTVVFPFEEDSMGKKTIDDTLEKVCDLLIKLKS